MSKVVALSPEGVKRVSNNVARASQNEIGGKAMTDFDARIADIKELASTNPELALKKASITRGNLEGERLKAGVETALMFLAGAGLSVAAPVLGAGVGAAALIKGAVKLWKIAGKEDVADRTFYAINHFVHGRIDKDQMNEQLGIDTKETKQSVNTSSEEVKAKPNNNNGNPEGKAFKALKRNNQILPNKNTHLR